jgi:NTE family protein
MTDPHKPATGPSPTDSRQTVLVLQGGGALGSYQAGVYEALAQGGVMPDWIAGVSIGAINAALIAGNPPARRVERLHAFWHRVTSPTAHFPSLGLSILETMEQRVGAAGAMLFGQPGFFRPRNPLDWLGAAGPVSIYDTSDLRRTLEELVDFGRINAGPLRLSVGAVEVATGNMIYFDTAQMRLGPDHIMASGALPPGFPPVVIDGRAYWDGGLISNTPLQYVMSEKPRRHSVMFQVDVFPARGPLPQNLDQVAEREKDIRFSSRTRTGTNDAGARQAMRRHVRRFLDRLPPELANDPVAHDLRDFACGAEIDVVQLIYRPDVPQGSQKDFQFDHTTMQRRWAAGLADATRTLAVAPWQQPVPPDTGFRTFDVTNPQKPLT